MTVKKLTEPVDGYVYIDVDGEINATLTLDGTPVFVRASGKIPALTGMTAVKRGPLVYCFEGVDNGCVRAIRVDRSKAIELGGYNELLGATTLVVSGERVEDFDGLYTTDEEKTTPVKAIAVPYYTWGNRGENEMRVWMQCK